MLTEGVVLAGLGGLVWAWIVWIIVGGIAGWLASLLVRGTGLGILGDIIVGIIGGLIGGFILGVIFGVAGAGIFWTFVTAFVGAVILLFIVKLITGNRATSRRAL